MKNQEDALKQLIDQSISRLKGLDGFINHLISQLNSKKQESEYKLTLCQFSFAMSDICEKLINLNQGYPRIVQDKFDEASNDDRESN